MIRKLSELIIEMIDPFHDDDENDIAKLVSVATFAWNMTIVPQTEAKKMKAEFLNVFQGNIEQIQALEELICYFRMVKSKHYGNDNRFIVNYHLKTFCEPIRLQVASRPYSYGELSSQETGRKII